MATLACFALLAACSQSVQVRTESPAHVILDGEDLGEVTPEGTTVEIPLGGEPVPYVLKRGDVEVEGTIPREPHGAWTQAGALCTGSSGCGLLGCGLANPGACAQFSAVVIPVVGWQFAYGAVAAMLVSPAWTTACLSCAGCGLGGVGSLFLLSLLPVGVAPEVLLTPSGGDEIPLADVESPTEATSLPAEEP